MRNLGRLLLLAAALLLAFVIGVLVGRRQTAEPVAQQAPSGVQITTEDAPAAPAEPLPAPVQAPPPAAPVVRPPVDQQVQEDAAAVGMTTRDEPETAPAQEGAAASDRPSAAPGDQPPGAAQ